MHQISDRMQRVIVHKYSFAKKTSTIEMLFDYLLRIIRNKTFERYPPLLRRKSIEVVVEVYY